MDILNSRPRPRPRVLWLPGLIIACFNYFIFYLVYLRPSEPVWVSSSYDWSQRPQTYPVANELKHPPTGPVYEIPQIQHDFGRKHNWIQASRRNEVVKSFKSCWNLYRTHAWGKDELKPISLSGNQNFGGWGATLVDSLDSLWILGLHQEFHQALVFVAQIDWHRTEKGALVSLFETNIRYLGGLLSAYDLSHEAVLLRKAVELGDMLYNGFDTPLRMPANEFHFEGAMMGMLEAKNKEAVAHVGSLSLEFTRLTQLTGDPKYFDAIERVKGKLEETQMRTKLPGLWPREIDLRNGFLVSGNFFTMGAMVDSLYEYLPKMYMLLGGLDPAYETMYVKAATTAKDYLLFRPMQPNKSVDILFAGDAWSNGAGSIDLEARSQHLTCFVGGMFALGARLFPELLSSDMATAAQLTRGCVWAYNVMPTRVMPETFMLFPCPDLDRCAWNASKWEESVKNKRLPKGFQSVHHLGYELRPEAVESLFYMWRITGDEAWRDEAWDMFLAIRSLTQTTTGANSAVKDVTRDGRPEQKDSMESFWLAETLKYFYLIFSEPELISLDDYVLNTEAHPFRIPKP